MPSFLSVECYSGYKADQQPLRFRFVTTSRSSPSGLGRSVIYGARTYRVIEILDRWYGPDYECFKVRANDSNLYVLRHQLGNDFWSLDSFRRDGAASSTSHR